MAVADQPTRESAIAALPGVARVLVMTGKIGQPEAEAIYAAGLKNGRMFIPELIASGKVSGRELAHTLSQTFAAPLIDVHALDREQLPDDLIANSLSQKYQVLALSKRNGRLVLVTADPSNHEAADKIKFVTQLGVEWVIGEFDKLTRLIEARSRSSNAALDSLIGNEFDFGNDALSEGNKTEDDDESNNDAEDAPVVRFLHKVLLDAINMGASDLHFEPYEHNYRIRYRVDGELQEVVSPPVGIKDRLASRIKVISRLDISEKRVPQDGRMKLKIAPGRAVDFRISTLPTLFGEKIVIRILDSSSTQLGIDALGYEPIERQRLLDAIERPYGMILVTGPTGSGKTVSLYTCLNLLNKPGVNISTAEDPSEINMPGVNQVNINEKAGLTFAVALRAFLRQDPDIIMVGEVRDLETADIAVKAAQTGHLVLSTLHTNDAPATLTRLRNMGVEPFNIASSVLLITAQRLARKLCKKCKTPAEIPFQNLLDAGFDENDLDGSWIPYHPVGCEECNNGYKGRVGIYEVMPISEALEQIILADGDATDIERQARADGVRSMRQSGLLKVKAGITSLEEVLAVTNQ